MSMEICKKYTKLDCPYFEENCRNALNDKGELNTGAPLDCVCPKFLAFQDAKDPQIVEEELKKMNVTGTEKMDIMLGMQKVFAERFHKVDNLSKSEIDHWTNAYLVCIEDEIVEAMEFIDIYPSTIKDFNLKEYRKELIDILHFVMDGMHVAGMKYSDLVNIHETKCGSLEGKDLLESISNSNVSILNGLQESNKYIYTLNYILRDIRLVRQCISWKHWKKPSNSIDTDKIFNAYYGMLSNLVLAFQVSGMNSEDVYNVYVNKNIENVLRQKWGY